MENLISNMDVWDLVIAALFVVAGAYVGLLRTKLKQIGELFLKVHEYTDDKRLDETERKDIIKRFLAIISKWDLANTKNKEDAKKKI